MIRYEWRTALTESERESVRDLLEAAAEYDREAEFSRIDFADIDRDLDAGGTSGGRLLLIWMLPRQTQVGQADEPEVIAGVLRLVLDEESVGDVQLVVAPELRSLGIVTLFVERAGLDVSAEGGWLGTGATGLQAWAQGNHPAAGRLSNRHLIPRTARVWKLVRPLDEPWDECGLEPGLRIEECSSSTTELDVCAGSSAARSAVASAVADPQKSVTAAIDAGGAVVGVLVLDRRPLFVVEYGKCAVVEHISIDRSEGDPVLTGALLTAAFEQAAAGGLDGVVVHVDSEQSDLVTACRRARFQHDRTDVRFEL